MSFKNPKIRKILYFDAVLFLLGLAGIYQLVERAGFNTTSDLELHVSESRKLVLENIINTDLDSVFMAHDTLIAINTHPVSSVDELEVITDAQQIDAQIVIQISRSEKLTTLTVPLKEFYSLSYILIALFVGVVFFSHGLFVLIKRPEERAARVYHWVSVWAAMIIMTTWGRYTIEPIGLGYIVRIIFCAAYAFTPVIFFHFSFLFPQQKFSSWKKIIIPGYILASILFLWTSISFISAVYPTLSIKNVRIFLLGFDSTRWFFIICLLSGVFNFIHSFFIATDAVERKKILWLLLGMVGPVGFVILWQIPQALNYSAFLPEEVIILIASIMPLTFTISIVRYHIMDIYLIINRSTVYGIVVVFLLTLYALIIAIAIKVIDTFTTESSIITSAFAAIFLALLFEPLRKQVQKIVDKKFFKVKYNYRIAQRKFLDEMNMGVDQKILALFTVDKLDELLQPQCINLLMMNDTNGKLTPFAKKNCELANENYIEQLKKLTAHSSSQIFSFPDQLEPGIQYKEIHLEGDHGISMIIPIRRQNGTLLGLLCLGRKRSQNFYGLEDVDLLKTVITQLGLATERLTLQGRLLLKQEEAKRLDELNKMQSFFISSVSHDLQTPLTAINVYLDLIQEKKNLTNSKRSEYLDTIRGESVRLSKLINNVLDISKIERGVKKYDFSDLNLNDLVMFVYNSMKYQLSQYKFEVNVELPDTQIFILGDQDSLDRVLTNLISNSIKYSTKDKYLSIKLSSSDNHAVIEIIDHGVGIEQEDQTKIFDIFYRSEEKQIQSIGGAGLGLAIVDHVVKAHQGKIELESKPGQGSRFTIWIPINKAKRI